MAIRRVDHVPVELSEQQLVKMWLFTDALVGSLTHLWRAYQILRGCDAKGVHSILIFKCFRRHLLQCHAKSLYITKSNVGMTLDIKP